MRALFASQIQSAIHKVLADAAKGNHLAAAPDAAAPSAAAVAIARHRALKVLGVSFFLFYFLTFFLSFFLSFLYLFMFLNTHRLGVRALFALQKDRALLTTLHWQHRGELEAQKARLAATKMMGSAAAWTEASRFETAEAAKAARCGTPSHEGKDEAEDKGEVKSDVGVDQKKPLEFKSNGKGKVKSKVGYNEKPLSRDEERYLEDTQKELREYARGVVQRAMDVRRTHALVKAAREAHDQAYKKNAAAHTVRALSDERFCAEAAAECAVAEQRCVDAYRAQLRQAELHSATRKACRPDVIRAFITSHARGPTPPQRRSGGRAWKLPSKHSGPGKPPPGGRPPFFTYQNT